MTKPKRASFLFTIVAATGAALSLPHPAEAHVKWFCAYDIAGRPDGLENVLCQDFELLTAVAILALLAGGLLEKTFIGAGLIRSLDRVTGFLTGHVDLMIRASLGFFLVSLWALGGIILTPELKTVSPLIPLLQIFIAACLVSPKTLPLAGAGLTFLFCDGVVRYGAFHMMDYPIFLGIAAYLAMTGLGRSVRGISPMDVLRWSASITLMWASVEKWAYPEWSYPLFISHPELSMGYDPAFFMRAAGVVEFTLSFALLMTPLVRRCAAIMLTATFVSAIGEFGKIDAIGHAPIIAVLIAIIVNDGVSCEDRPRLVKLPLQYGGALAIFIALYYTSHTLSFGVQPA